MITTKHIDELQHLQSSYFIAKDKQKAIRLRNLIDMLIELMAENERHHTIATEYKLRAGYNLIITLI